jgi:hypothetical protein
MVRLFRHRRTKGPATDKPHLNHRATSRLHYLQAEAWTPARRAARSTTRDAKDETVARWERPTVFDEVRGRVDPQAQAAPREPADAARQGLCTKGISESKGGPPAARVKCRKSNDGRRKHAVHEAQRFYAAQPPVLFGAVCKLRKTFTCNLLSNCQSWDRTMTGNDHCGPHRL